MSRAFIMFAAAAIAAVPFYGAIAQTRVSVGQPLARFGKLRPGVHRYARYRIEGNKRTLIDIWERRISFEPNGGRPAMRIRQRWDVATPKPGGIRVLEQDSWFEPGTFRPLTHVRRETRDGPEVLKAYRFLAHSAVGLADVPGNAANDFVMPFAEPAFNFEYDMELLQALPLSPGYAADIVFYDAGIDPKADHYVFKVAGSDDIVGWNGRPVHCWVVTADYNTGVVRSRFWFDKATQVMVREVTGMPDGSTLVKTLLPAEPEG